MLPVPPPPPASLGSEAGWGHRQAISAEVLGCVLASWGHCHNNHNFNGLKQQTFIPYSGG